MKLVNVNIARSIWLFDDRELNPRGKRLYPEIFNPLVQRYTFRVFPTTPEHLNRQNGVLFQDGGFRTPDGTISVDLSYYSDGLVATSSSSTEDMDAFLDDVLRWASEQYGLRYDSTLVQKKEYLSTVQVQFEHSLHGACERLQRFASHLSSLDIDAKNSTQEFAGARFTSDPASRFSFSIERRLNAPFSENRYYSDARLPTKQHLSALEEFERILT